jgi:hypothetical protein
MDALLTKFPGRIKDINTHCLKQFNTHWENNNHRLWECRKQEMDLNKCVFDKLVRYPNMSFSLSTVAVTNDLTNLFLNRASRRPSPAPPKTRPRCTSDPSSCTLHSPVRNTNQPTTTNERLIIHLLEKTNAVPMVVGDLSLLCL